MMDAILAGEKLSIGLFDRETSFTDPVLSMVDGKRYANRKDYDNHLKENNCEIVGNDWDSKAEKVKDYGNDVTLFDKKREKIVDTVDGI